MPSVGSTSASASTSNDLDSENFGDFPIGDIIPAPNQVKREEEEEEDLEEEELEEVDEREDEEEMDDEEDEPEEYRGVPTPELARRFARYSKK